jgi:PKD repeat protein
MIAPGSHALEPRGGCGLGRRRRVGRYVLQAVIASLAALVVGPVAIAAADGPSLPITIPLPGTVTNNPTPSFSGSTQQEGTGKVTLFIFRAPLVNGEESEQEPFELLPPWAESWEITAKPLVDGTYTALAIEPGAPTTSPGVTFTIDTKPPLVTLTSPANGSSTTSGSVEVGGAAGTAKGDVPSVTLKLFAGGTPAAQAQLEAVALQAPNGRWSTTLGGLGPGTYTVRAEQSDEAGNTGVSQQTTFTITSTPPPSPPVAAFSWVPSAPNAGENVSFVSSSTDLTSPITTFAWSLESNSPFFAGRPLFTASFANPGNHVVRLRVTDALGLSNVATETVPVRAPEFTVMEPFPIVRIAGSETSNGAKISLLTVQAPVGARVSVSCRGKGCKPRSESRMALAGARRHNAGVVVLAFRPFERSLPAGVVLKIQVSKPGEIGKYTSFAIRRNKLPVRNDACLWPTNSKPIPCPTS